MTDDNFIDRCMDAWDRGFNTADIAIHLQRPEAFVAMCVRMGREKRLVEKARVVITNKM